MASVVALGGRQITSRTIEEDGFVYDGILVGLAAGAVREMIANPAGPRSIATLQGLQFVLPQTVAQASPDASEPREADADAVVGPPFDEEAPTHADLLDGTPIAAHPDLDGGLVIVPRIRRRGTTEGTPVPPGSNVRGRSGASPPAWNGMHASGV